jgi:hypothetical protein
MYYQNPFIDISNIYGIINAQAQLINQLQWQNYYLLNNMNQTQITLMNMNQQIFMMQNQINNLLNKNNCNTNNNNNNNNNNNEEENLSFLMSRQQFLNKEQRTKLDTIFENQGIMIDNKNNKEEVMAYDPTFCSFGNFDNSFDLNFGQYAKFEPIEENLLNTEKLQQLDQEFEQNKRELLDESIKNDISERTEDKIFNSELIENNEDDENITYDFYNQECNSDEMV